MLIHAFYTAVAAYAGYTFTHRRAAQHHEGNAARRREARARDAATRVLTAAETKRLDDLVRELSQQSGWTENPAALTKKAAMQGKSFAPTESSKAVFAEFAAAERKLQLAAAKAERRAHLTARYGKLIAVIFS